MHDYHFEQAWTDGTTAAATQPHLAQVLVQAQKNIMIVNVDEELDPNRNAASITVAASAEESNTQGFEI